MKHRLIMLHRFLSGIYPLNYQSEKAGSKNESRSKMILRRMSLSLAGCSSAEPASVSAQREQKLNILTIFTTCQISQPFTKPLEDPERCFKEAKSNLMSDLTHYCVEYWDPIKDPWNK